MVDAVSISTTAHLMVPKRVSWSQALGTDGVVLVQWQAKPVLETQSKLLVLAMEAQGKRRDHIQPVSGMRGAVDWARALERVSGAEARRRHWEASSMEMEKAR